MTGQWQGIRIIVLNSNIRQIQYRFNATSHLHTRRRTQLETALELALYYRDVSSSRTRTRMLYRVLLDVLTRELHLYNHVEHDR